MDSEVQERKYGDFRDLEVWKQCKSIRREIWSLCKSFPKEEKYRLSDQMIRASRSSTACIAEGYGRYHYQENIQFWARTSAQDKFRTITFLRECFYGQEATTGRLQRVYTVFKRTKN